ncbi:MAG: hypothetical protein H7231_01030 [Rhodoferax sp.]|nr:hypothetical protein [Actinomycetota bacterium]
MSTSRQSPDTADTSTAINTNPGLLAASWLVVGVPLVYGIYQTLLKASKLFTG